MSGTMAAVAYDRTGPAEEVLRLVDLPVPEPGPGEVLVRLAASGVNPADCNRRGGRGYDHDGRVIIPHSDGAGTIAALGPGVAGRAMGDRVWLYNGQRGRDHGTAAQYIALDADLVAPLPDGVPFDTGACLGIPAMTAHRCLFADGPVAGQWVLVTGGAGAVGNYAVQLAAWAGARVIATASTPDKAADATAAGAQEVINYREADVAGSVLDLTGGAGVDQIVEVDFGGNLAASRRAIAVNGTIAAYASRGEHAQEVDFYALMRRNVTLRAVLLNNCPLAARRQAQADINRWLAEAGGRHRIAAAFPLAEAWRAHAAVERGDKRGTVIVRCDGQQERG